MADGRLIQNNFTCFGLDAPKRGTFGTLARLQYHQVFVSPELFGSTRSPCQPLHAGVGNFVCALWIMHCAAPRRLNAYNNNAPPTTFSVAPTSSPKPPAASVSPPRRSGLSSSQQIYRRLLLCRQWPPLSPLAACEEASSVAPPLDQPPTLPVATPFPFYRDVPAPSRWFLDK